MAERETAEQRRYGPPLPGWLERKKKWLADHHMTLVTMADTPHSIALGSAIGMFFGFTPLYTLKTLLSIVFAWVCRSNKIAAAIAGNLHDVFLFAMPAVYFFEYKMGCWMLRRPPTQSAFYHHFDIRNYLHWHFVVQVIWPALVGSLLLGIPAALITYFMLRMVISRARTPKSSG